MFWRKASSAHSAPLARRSRSAQAASRHSAPLTRRARPVRPQDSFLLENRLGRLQLGHATRFVALRGGVYKTYDAALAFAATLAPKALPQLSVLVGKVLPPKTTEVLSHQWQHLTAVVSPSIIMNRLAGMGRQASAVVRHMAPVSHMFNEVGRLRYRVGAIFQQVAHGLPRLPRPQNLQPATRKRPAPIRLAPAA